MTQEKQKTKEKRSMFTTIFASILGLIILTVTILVVPISNFLEGMSFGIGLLLVFICVLTAVDGRKGTIKELIYSLSFWR